MSELSPAVRALLDQASAHHDPAPQEVERTLARLHGSLAFAAPALGAAIAIAGEGASAASEVAVGAESIQAAVSSVHAGTAAASAPAATYAGGALVGAQAVKIYLVVAAVIGGIGTFAAFGGPVAPPRASIAPPHAAPVQSDSAPPSEPVVQLRPVVPEKAAPKREATMRAVKRASAAEELSVIEAAQSALQRAEPARALVLLEAYARRDAAGQLRAEREGLRAIALCQSDRGREGRAARDAFLARWPGAPIASRVESACAEAAR